MIQHLVKMSIVGSSLPRQLADLVGNGLLEVSKRDGQGEVREHLRQGEGGGAVWSGGGGAGKCCRELPGKFGIPMFGIACDVNITSLGCARNM